MIEIKIDFEEECSKCYGNGYLSGERNPCERCHGTGYAATELDDALLGFLEHQGFLVKKESES